MNTDFTAVPDGKYITLLGGVEVEQYAYHEGGTFYLTSNVDWGPDFDLRDVGKSFAGWVEQ